MKSLRVMARELGVSASYLSQVKNGKRKPSEKVLSRLNMEVLSSVKQSVNQNSIDFFVSKRYNSPCRAEVAQVVEQRTENPRVSGSTPLLGTVG